MLRRSRAYERLGQGVRAYPVLRTTANAVGAGTSVESPTVLGDSLGRLRATALALGLRRPLAIGARCRRGAGS